MGTCELVSEENQRVFPVAPTAHVGAPLTFTRRRTGTVIEAPAASRLTGQDAADPSAPETVYIKYNDGAVAPEGSRWDITLAHLPTETGETGTGAPVTLRDAIEVPHGFELRTPTTNGIELGAGPATLRWRSRGDFDRITVVFYPDFNSELWSCVSRDDGRITIPSHVIETLGTTGWIDISASREHLERIPDGRKILVTEQRGFVETYFHTP